MRRLRFSIAGMLKVVVVLAVAFAALREANDFWDSILFALTSLGLLMAVLMAVHRRERRRAFWLGFCLFGWAYLIASLFPMIESRLPTTRGLAYLDSLVPERSPGFTIAFTAPGGSTTAANTVPNVTFSNVVTTLTPNQPGVVRFWSIRPGMLMSGPNGTTENFVRIGHSLMALILGIFGAWLSRRLYDRGQPRRSDEPGATAISVPSPDGT